MEEYGHDEQGRARIVLPPQGLGKVIQVKIKEPEDWLFIGKRLSILHSDMLKESLETFGLHYDEKEIDGGRLIVNPEGDNYLLVEAGKTKREGDVIEIGDKSLDYNLWFEGKYFDKILPCFIPNNIKFKFRELII